MKHHPAAKLRDGTDGPPSGEVHTLPAVPPLTSLYLYISGVCNLSCRHCWVAATEEKGRVRTPYLSVEQADRAIEEATPLGLQDVKLTGGEPLLHPRFKEIVLSAESRNLGLRIETNGVLLTDETAAFLGGLNTLTHISVSLDGPNASVHEGIRRTPG
jgi:molybdenum cofactor biosynthesis enzyme MoaA